MVLARRMVGARVGGAAGGGGSPVAVYGGVGSPHKLSKGKSPFKRRVSGLASMPKGASGASGVAANIRVAVRVRPENGAEKAGAFRYVNKTSNSEKVNKPVLCT